ALGFVAMGCESGGVGDPCIPEDEYNPNFASFSSEEVNVESRSFQCETRVCLVNKFQGRVSCPYGSPGLPDGVAPADANAEQIKNLCSIPGTDPGSGSVQDKVTAAVTGQLVDRREDRAVYCSCRCANAQGNKDDGATYCDCPSGFSCEKLVDDVGLGGTQLAGSYCVKEGTNQVGTGATCSDTLQNCDAKYDY
ncbi:MAG: hypothetical protein KC492_38120, partial [Myxococcales bacterium]|nr:hypothetical protein [Myxococcales bacterium]